VWLGFGAVAVPIVVDRANWITVVYAVLSLTVVRMMPVALALIGAGLDRETVLFIGWFGPRDLASLLFALLALEELGPAADQAVAVIAVTVFLSVLAHGVSAAPLAARYGQAAGRGQEPGGPTPDLPVRGRPRRLSADPG
jgi:sodium/hydrogen antiporter